MTVLQCADKSLDLSEPVVMGILNVTPDSFSDGGALYSQQQLDVDKACEAALEMVAAGAKVIDIGGESTRPGAAKVGLDEEMRRVLPVVEALAQQSEVIISLDTSSPELMDEGLRLGACMVNDVRALQRPGALEVAAKYGAGVCLMHMQGQPDTMQDKPEYSQVVEQVNAFLQQRVQACVDAGIALQSICLDPGFGFGKRLEDNLTLLAKFEQLQKNKLPLLAGLSRKSMIGAILDNEVDQRLSASLALATIAVMHGADIVRVHDVKQTYEAVAMAAAVKKIR